MKKILLIISLAALTIGLLSSCKKDVPVSVSGVTLEPATLEISVDNDFKLTATVAPENATNKTVSWSSDKTDVATVDNEGIVHAVTPGTANITVTTTDGGKTATCVVTVVIPTDIEVEYGGVKYHAKLFGDNYWFIENLRYVPSGYTVSNNYLESTSDKSKCIFYPAKQTGVDNNKITYEPGSEANTELNEKVGLLYNIYAYLQKTELPAPTDTVAHKAYNGAQGICPDGWHLPTHEEWNTLVSYSTKSDIWEVRSGENDKALFYETYNYDKNGTPTPTSHTSITKANECGFNFYPVGTITATNTAPFSTGVAKAPEEFKNMFSLTYFASSSICNLGSSTSPSIKSFGVMTIMTNDTNYSHGRLSLAAVESSYAVSVRCVKSAK